MRVCVWWKGERRTRTCHFKSQPIHAPTQPWRQKQIRYIVHDTKEVFELKWKWKHRNLFVIRMTYGFLFDTSDELDDDFSWFIRPDIENQWILCIDVCMVHVHMMMTMRFHDVSLLFDVEIGTFWKLGFWIKTKASNRVRLLCHHHHCCCRSWRYDIW